MGVGGEQASLTPRLAIRAGAFSLFFVAVMLCLCAAMPPPDWGWSAATPFASYLSGDVFRIVCGMFAGFGLMFALAAKRLLYFAFFIPALLVATLPYPTLSLETALLRNPIAFDRAWQRYQELPGNTLVSSVNSDEALRSALIAKPETALRKIGSTDFLQRVVGTSALEARRLQWFDTGNQTATAALSAPNVQQIDVNPFTQQVSAAQAALAEASKTTRFRCPRIIKYSDAPPCDDTINIPDTTAQTNAVTAAVTAEATAKAQAESAASAEAQRLQAAASTLSSVAGLARTFEAAGAAAINWYWTVFISISTLTLLFLFGAINYRIAIWGTGIALIATGGLAVLSFVGTILSEGGKLSITALASIVMSLAVMAVGTLSGAVIGRMLEDNVPLIQKISKIRRDRVLGEAALKWLPLLACVVLGTFIANRATKATHDFAYNIPIAAIAEADAAESCKNTDKRLVFQLLPPTGDLEVDVDHSVGCHFSSALKAARDANSASAQQSSAAVGSAGDMAIAAVNRVIPTSLPCDADGHNIRDNRGTCVSDAFNYPECRWWQLICKAKRIPHRAAESAYANARADAIGWVSAKVHSIKATADADAPIAQAQVDAFALTAFENVSIEARTGLWQGFRVWDAIHAGAFVIFTIAACKSAVYVFSRIFHSQRPLRSRKTSKERRLGIVVSTVPKYKLEKPGTYYLKMGADPGEVAPKGPWFPQPLKMFFARLPFRLFFNFFTLKEGQHVPFSEEGNGRFVEIEIEDSQKVAFYPTYLYAWSDTVRFSTTWSFRLPNLLRGRISTSTATGPGRIILFSKGSVEAIDSDYNGQGYPPTRLMAWSADMDVTTSSDVSTSAIYFSGVLIRPQDDSVAIFDVSAGTQMFPGAVKFIPLLLSPI
ncbi:hypothetical protein GOC00_08535 [Sinorhizobium meliloti]|nr:hypothetical protein [Sinorhizobium meliloti]MDX0000550.1 hypothetical protein [Sinorhizobium meliloti]MDX0075285.1 hypothetical protein [Sinorhizobium meliloti]MDX0210185.1 hypothetical protein [Sinorhizobium meliloti]MDX0353812.1 hypothetical protein [Sinorhizobium meliloti]